MQVRRVCLPLVVVVRGLILGPHMIFVGQYSTIGQLDLKAYLAFREPNQQPVLSESEIFLDVWYAFSGLSSAIRCVGGASMGESELVRPVLEFALGIH